MPRHITKKPCPRWTESEIQFLKDNYPSIGKMACAEKLQRTEAEVRWKASHLGLRIDPKSWFAIEWQARAAQGKVGKKRPEQAEVMKKNHREGKLIKTPEQRKASGETTRRRWKKNGHPRGMLGVKHTPETLAKISKSSRENFAKKSPEERRSITIKRIRTSHAKGAKQKPHGSWKQSWREIGGKKIYCRSRWEANYARILSHREATGEIAFWEHEPEVFLFSGVTDNHFSYLPDFRITFPDGSIEYHEVKGWVDERSKVKIARMGEYHPSVTLVVIYGKEYKELQKSFSPIIPEWEIK